MDSMALMPPNVTGVRGLVPHHLQSLGLGMPWAVSARGMPEYGCGRIAELRQPPPPGCPRGRAMCTAGWAPDARPFTPPRRRKDTTDHAATFRSKTTAQAPHTRRQVWPMTKTMTAGALQRGQVDMTSLVGEEVGPVAVPALGLHRPTSDRRSRSLPRRHGHGAYR